MDELMLEIILELTEDMTMEQLAEFRESIHEDNLC